MVVTEKLQKHGRRFGFITPTKVVSGRFDTFTGDTALRGLIDKPWMSHNCELTNSTKKRNLLEIMLHESFIYNRFTGEVEYSDFYRLNKNNLVLAYSIETNYQADPQEQSKSKMMQKRDINESATLDIENFRVEGKVSDEYRMMIPTSETIETGNPKYFDVRFFSMPKASIIKAENFVKETPSNFTTKYGDTSASFNLGNTEFPITSIDDETHRRFKSAYWILSEGKQKLFDPIYAMNDDFLIFNQNYWEGGI